MTQPLEDDSAEEDSVTPNNLMLCKNSWGGGIADTPALLCILMRVERRGEEQTRVAVEARADAHRWNI